MHSEIYRLTIKGAFVQFVEFGDYRMCGDPHSNCSKCTKLRGTRLLELRQKNNYITSEFGGSLR